MGTPNIIEVIYKRNESASESGFDALLDLPFDSELCVGYPTIHARIKDMANTGYRRQCAWIQLVKREYYSSDTLLMPDENNLSIDSPFAVAGVPFYGFGSPAEIYDAPCNNLNGNVWGKWTAYTYLVEYPTRMNEYKIAFLAGFQWGYEEAIIDGRLTVKMSDVKPEGYEQWKEHINYLEKEFPQYDYI